MPNDDKALRLGLGSHEPSQDELDREEAMRSLDQTGEMPLLDAGLASARMLPAYAPPNEAYHPDSRIRGRWWLVAAASLVGLVVASLAWGTSSRVSSVGILGVEKAVVEEAVAMSPAQPGTKDGSGKLGGLVGLEAPGETVPDEGSALDGAPNTQSPFNEELPGLTLPDDYAADGTGDTYGFTWPDGDGERDFSLTVPSDPDSGTGAYGFGWQDEGGGRHEFSYRQDDDSLTLRLDDEELSLSLDELEELLGGGAGDAWHDYPGSGMGGGYGHLPGDGWGARDPGYGEGEVPGQAIPGWRDSYGVWS